MQNQKYRYKMVRLRQCCKRGCPASSVVVKSKVRHPIRPLKTKMGRGSRSHQKLDKPRLTAPFREHMCSGAGSKSLWLDFILRSTLSWQSGSTSTTTLWHYSYHACHELSAVDERLMWLRSSLQLVTRSSLRAMRLKLLTGWWLSARLDPPRHTDNLYLSVFILD